MSDLLEKYVIEHIYFFREYRTLIHHWRYRKRLKNLMRKLHYKLSRLTQLAKYDKEILLKNNQYCNLIELFDRTASRCEMVNFEIGVLKRKHTKGIN